jgi:hypothetical protein
MSKIIMVGMANRPEIPDTGKVLLYARGKKLRALDEDGKEFNLNQDGWGINFIIGSTLQSVGTGYKGYVRIPYDCYIDKVTLTGDVTGQNTWVDIWRTSTYPPLPAGSICGGNAVPMTGCIFYEDDDLIGWQTGIYAGDFLGFYVTGGYPVTVLTVSLSGRKI